MQSSAHDEGPGSAETPDGVPRGMVMAADWAWRLLAIAGVVAVFVLLLSEIKLIVIPFMIAILISGLLVPCAAFLRRHGWPPWLAIVVTLVVVLGVMTGLAFLVVNEIVGGLPSLVRQTIEAYRDARGFLMGGPFHFTPEQLHDFYRDVLSAAQSDSTGLAARVASVGSSIGRFVTGLLLTVFASVILLIDGAGVWRFVVRLFPRRARAAIDGAGRAGWVTLTDFVRVQIFVALVDALGIGVIAGVLGIPLAVPIAIAVFVGSFVPVVGAVVTGILAVFVALVYNGPVVALVMLAGVLFIQQVEGHVLQPLVMGTAVKVHPLAVVLAVATGSLLAGIAGALFAVPIVATANAMAGSLAEGRWRQPHRTDEDDMVPRQPATQKGVPDDV